MTFYEALVAIIRREFDDVVIPFCIVEDPDSASMTELMTFYKALVAIIRKEFDDDGILFCIVEDLDSASMTELIRYASEMTSMGLKIAVFPDDDWILPGFDNYLASALAEIVCLEMFKETTVASMGKEIDEFLDDDGILSRIVEDPDSASMTELKKADNVSFSPIVEDPGSAVMTKLVMSQFKCVHVSDVVPEEVMIQMPIPPPAMSAGSYPPPRSFVSIADYNASMKQSAIGKFDEITAASMGQKNVVLGDYNGTLSPIVIYFLNYLGPSYATVMTIAILFLIPIIDILFLIPIIASIFYLLSLLYAAPPPLQDITLETWPNYGPQVDFTDCCSICLVDYDDEEEEGEDNPLRTLPDCGHVFHAMCVDVWLRRNPTCPICRAWAR